MAGNFVFFSCLNAINSGVAYIWIWVIVCLLKLLGDDGIVQGLLIDQWKIVAAWFKPRNLDNFYCRMSISSNLFTCDAPLFHILVLRQTHYRKFRKSCCSLINWSLGVYLSLYLADLSRDITHFFLYEFASIFKVLVEQIELEFTGLLHWLIHFKFNYNKD